MIANQITQVNNNAAPSFFEKVLGAIAGGVYFSLKNVTLYILAVLALSVFVPVFTPVFVARVYFADLQQKGWSKPTSLLVLVLPLPLLVFVAAVIVALIMPILTLALVANLVMSIIEGWKLGLQKVGMSFSHDIQSIPTAIQNLHVNFSDIARLYTDLIQAVKSGNDQASRSIIMTILQTVLPLIGIPLSLLKQLSPAQQNVAPYSNEFLRSQKQQPLNTDPQSAEPPVSSKEQQNSTVGPALEIQQAPSSFSFKNNAVVTLYQPTIPAEAFAVVDHVQISPRMP